MKLLKWKHTTSHHTKLRPIAELRCPLREQPNKCEGGPAAEHAVVAGPPVVLAADLLAVPGGVDRLRVVAWRQHFSSALCAFIVQKMWNMPHSCLPSTCLPDWIPGNFAIQHLHLLAVSGFQRGRTFGYPLKSGCNGWVCETIFTLLNQAPSLICNTTSACPRNCTI